ncbi:MAG TPA: hypothetical protein VN626_03300, partial [Clostridia bacterium]|nr:hypothetical protein [Clostridia bacterium]
MALLRHTGGRNTVPIAPRSSLNQNLEIADTSLWFQVILVIGGIISLFVAHVLREQIAGNLSLNNCETSALLRTKIASSII